MASKVISIAWLISGHRAYRRRISGSILEQIVISAKLANFSILEIFSPHGKLITQWDMINRRAVADRENRAVVKQLTETGFGIDQGRVRVANVWPGHLKTRSSA